MRCCVIASVVGSLVAVVVILLVIILRPKANLETLVLGDDDIMS